MLRNSTSEMQSAIVKIPMIWVTGVALGEGNLDVKDRKKTYFSLSIFCTIIRHSVVTEGIGKNASMGKELVKTVPHIRSISSNLEKCIEVQKILILWPGDSLLEISHEDTELDYDFHSWVFTVGRYYLKIVNNSCTERRGWVNVTQ